jgi:pyruvate/2-oxoglutarate dehydrogenase complex dihydrolipoamide dehydrogenase (E3) component
MNEGRPAPPDDDAERTRLHHVHPRDWQNPAPTGRYHLVVVGAGTAGLVAAAGAAGLGARVALIERHDMGGDCLNVGCVPSKGVLAAARAWHAARAGAAFGAPVAGRHGDFAEAMRRMRRLRARISANDSARRFRELGVDVFFGDGCFVDREHVRVGEDVLRFRRAVIATGARAAAPAIDGLDEAGYLTNETIFDLTELPARLAVVGAGPIGCELAQAFVRFGAEVTMLDAGDRILPRDDAHAAALVHAALERDGVRYLAGVRITRVGRGERSKTIHYEHDGAGRTLECDAILVAVGRKPNTEGLGLDAAGVATGGAGVVVDRHLRTSNRRIYACGDVASEYRFTHAADAQARIVIQNALFFGRARVDRLVMPWCTYTSPELAHVGMTERDAANASIPIETMTIALSDVDRAVLDGGEEGFLRLHLRKGSDRIVGATLVSEHAGDMLGELALAVTAGVGLARIAATIHPYPTNGEVVKKAADAWRRSRLSPPVKRIFAAWFRLFA